MSVRNSQSAHNLLAIAGPTASGKTGLAVEIARKIGGAVLSADSRQVYRGLDIGSGKDLDEYVEGGPPVPYRLIDIADLSEEFSVYDYQRRFFAAFDEVRGEGLIPMLVGGTGLYIDAVLSGYAMAEAPPNPALRAELAELSHDALVERLKASRSRLHNTTDTQDRERVIRAIEIAEAEQQADAPDVPAVHPLVLGVHWERDVLRRRIRQRLEKRMAQGLIEEIEGLRERGVSDEKLHFLGLEYRYGLAYLRGEIRNRNDFVQKLNSAIAQFARKQEKWFRRIERQGWTIHWIAEADPDQAMAVLRAHWPALFERSGQTERGSARP